MSYVIEGGREGKSRLGILAQAMNRYSMAALLRAGISEGDNCLDVGCGGGDMTYAIAEIIGRGGTVKGVDRDAAIIALNEEGLKEHNVPGVSFRAADVFDLEGLGIYDLVYSRFLLSHLAEPERALKVLYNVLKPGGRLVVEDLQFPGIFVIRLIMLLIHMSAGIPKW